MVGSDLVYDAATVGFDWRRNHHELVESFTLLAHPPGSGARPTKVVLAVEKRRDSAHFIDSFFQTLRDCGWTYAHTPMFLSPPDRPDQKEGTIVILTMELAHT